MTHRLLGSWFSDPHNGINHSVFSDFYMQIQVYANHTGGNQNHKHDTIIDWQIAAIYTKFETGTFRALMPIISFQNYTFKCHCVCTRGEAREGVCQCVHVRLRVSLRVNEYVYLHVYVCLSLSRAHVCEGVWVCVYAFIYSIHYWSTIRSWSHMTPNIKLAYPCNCSRASHVCVSSLGRAPCALSTL